MKIGRVWQFAGLGVLAVATSVIVGLVVSGASLSPAPAYTPPPPQPTTSSTPHKTPVAVFIGDSYSAGAGGDGVRWTTLVAQDQGWREVNLARGGTGYMATSSTRGCGLSYCPTFGEMIPEAAKVKPDVVVVAGGRNDGKVDAKAINATFTELRKAVPEAKIYAVSPIWDDDPAPAWIGQQSKAVRAAVAAVGGDFLDIGEPLLDKPELMSSDGVHPNANGYRAIAAVIEAALG